MESQPFRYTPLSEHDSFRLLLLEPAPEFAAEIHCKLLHTTLSQCSYEIIDHYTALSYVWGDASQRRTIYVDDIPVSITASLASAFRDLRDEARVLRIWADAICIDQSNTDERNAQVRLMGDIYSTAHHTVIHLGSLSESAQTVLDAVRSAKWDSKSDDFPAIVDLAEKDVLTLPWFSRVWILQELILSQGQWVQCGKLRVRWTGLCQMLLSSGNAMSRSLKILADMEQVRGGRSAGLLLGLLQSRRGLGATDPRDMVFAHMGIASDRDKWDNDLIRIDYRKTCKQVYEGVALYFLQSVGPEAFFINLDRRQFLKSGHLGLIGSTSYEESTVVDGGIQNLASWAPDWSMPASYTVPMYRNDLLNTTTLKAKRYVLFLEEESILAMMGYEADVISEVSLVLPTFSQMKSSGRLGYQDAVNAVRALYEKTGGVYWSGTELGRHANIDLRRYEKEHKRLCDRICDEWIQIMENELPKPMSQPMTDELSSHQKFISGFKNWYRDKAASGVIFTGQDCEGMISLLDRHLMPTIDKSVLDGRRLALTQSGRVAVVPANARRRDEVAYLAGSDISVAMRYQPVGKDNPIMVSKVREAFEEKESDETSRGDAYVSSFADLFKTEVVRVQEYVLLGECYVDGLVGWAVGQAHEHCIFAFR